MAENSKDGAPPGASAGRRARSASAPAVNPAARAAVARSERGMSNVQQAGGVGTVTDVMRPIEEVAAEAGLLPEEVEPDGRYMAKAKLSRRQRLAHRPYGKLTYTTAITATPAGEGKTTMAIGLTQALGRLGKKAAVALREPSMGPVFGIKGGATGGGRARIVPEAEINLHFTGDIHA